MQVRHWNGELCCKVRNRLTWPSLAFKQWAQHVGTPSLEMAHLCALVWDTVCGMVHICISDERDSAPVVPFGKLRQELWNHL